MSWWRPLPSGWASMPPRVRLVVHWGMPATPEAYYQEARRAGRDGHPARCVLLYHPSDPGIHRRQLDVTFPPRRVVEELWANPDMRRRHPEAVVASAERLAAELGAGTGKGGLEEGGAAARGGRWTDCRWSNATRPLRDAGVSHCSHISGEGAEPCGNCDICRRSTKPLARLAAAFRWS